MKIYDVIKNELTTLLILNFDDKNVSFDYPTA